MSDAPSDSQDTSEESTLDDAYYVSALDNPISQYGWWPHVSGVFLIIASTILAVLVLRRPESVTLLSIGVISGYYTLICCWWIFGKQEIRIQAGVVLLGLLYGLQVALILGSPGSPPVFSLMLGFLMANAGFIFVKLSSVILLAWLSRVEIRHESEIDDRVSPRIRYGMAEIMLLTAIVAILVAIMRGLDDQASDYSDFGRVVLVLTCVSIFHFLIFWPMLFAGFIVKMRWLLILVSACIFALTVWGQKPFFDAVFGESSEGYVEVLMFDLPFAITVALHFAIANFKGYRLVQRVKT